MSFRPIQAIEKIRPARDIDSWVKTYKDAIMETHHDTSQLTLILPDDSLVVFGPPRLAHASGSDVFFPVGFLNNINVSESRQVQPLKAIGSRRHVFAATNVPVQGSIARMLFLGKNILAAIYGNATFGPDITDRNSKYESYGDGSGASYANLEEDIFRVPFGMGILYNSPATLAGGTAYYARAEYYEVCTLINRNASITAGQSMIMEQVSFMADRVVPWVGVDTLLEAQLDEPVFNVASMD